MHKNLTSATVAASLMALASCAPAPPMDPQAGTRYSIRCDTIAGTYTAWMGDTKITVTLPPPPPGFKHNVNVGGVYHDGVCDPSYPTYLDLYPDTSPHTAANLQTRWYLSSAVVPTNSLHATDTPVSSSVPSPTPGLDADFN